MKILFSLVLAIFFLSAAARAEEEAPSPFFSSAEIRAIDAEVAERPENPADPSPKRLYLDSLLYVGPSQWSAWLQGERWTPETKNPELKIVAASPEGLRLRLEPPLVKTGVEIFLAPHQSYDLTSGKVVEGR